MSKSNEVRALLAEALLQKTRKLNISLEDIVTRSRIAHSRLLDFFESTDLHKPTWEEVVGLCKAADVTLGAIIVECLFDDGVLTVEKRAGIISLASAFEDACA